MSQRNKEKRVVWPPRVLHQTPLGLLRDDTGNYIPRDIGRSTQFSNGHIVVQLGDTFPHDRSGAALEFRQNTCAIIPEPTAAPTLSIYQSHRDNEIPTFIEQRPGEYPNQMRFWSFSGIVEVPVGRRESDTIHGYTWFKTTRMYQDLRENYLHMEHAKVEYNTVTRQITSSRQTPNHTTISGTNGVREAENIRLPSFGSICALKVGEYVYLYGQSVDDNDKKDIMLARVALSQVDSVPFPCIYMFWAGTDWCGRVSNIRPIMSKIEHGQIFPTTIFGEKSEFKWLFVGNNSFGDSKVLMARAKAPEGPWDDGYVLGSVELYNSLPRGQDLAPFHYCVYPHTWAFGFDKEGTERTGDLMITWSEGGTSGHVLAALIRFEMEEKRVDEPDSLNLAENGPRRWTHGGPFAI